MKKNNFYFFGLFTILLVIGIVGCSNDNNKNSQNGAIAKAYDEYLYQLDNDPISKSKNKADSLNILEQQINSWLTSNIILQQSKTQLSQSRLQEINQKVQTYQRELFEFEYKSEIIRQKMDTVIIDSVIQKYYNNYISSYLLDEAYLRFVYVKCDKKEYVKEVEEWMNDSIDLYNLEDFCKEELQECHLYPDKWVALRKFQSKLGNIDIDVKKIKNGQSFIKIKDANVHYLIRIIDYEEKGNPAPISIVRNDIKSILLNKRKSEFINGFLKDLLTSELDKGNVKIFE